MPRVALVTAAVILALGVGVSFVPYLAKERDTVAGTPVPPPLGGRATVIPLDRGSKVCLDSVAMSTELEGAEVAVGTYFRRGEPLTLTLTGPGYHATGGVPGGYRDNSTVRFPIDGPEREIFGVACIRNDGERRIALYAAAPEHEAARPAATVDGRSVAAEPGFVFVEGRRSIAEGLPDALSRAALFRPGGAWLSWVIALAVIAAVLGGPLLALRWAARDDGE